MTSVSYYFAYGSNMNPDRVRERRMLFDHYQAGTLHDYRLVFNKRSVKYIGAASANVMMQKGAVTEGVVYRLKHADEITTMDAYEGYPVRYDRRRLPVTCGDDLVDAWVYVAKPDYIDNSLKPTRWYVRHLLAGKEFLSSTYIEQLIAVDCLPDTDMEPE
ncbi:MAG: gamma-glutamylcyclotransferase [Gammaproteobacteria bacterium]|nr:gamma-glutamylcyclotransferase [Gammaproteobacteria bacterium]